LKAPRIVRAIVGGDPRFAREFAAPKSDLAFRFSLDNERLQE